jgi:pyrroloquinoline quinone biosynthesis protein D
VSEKKPLELNDTVEISKHFRLQWEEVPKAYVLLYPEGRVQLNGSAGEIIKRVDGKATIAAIVEELQKTFNEPDLRTDVLAGLEIAYERGWIRVKTSAA